MEIYDFILYVVLTIVALFMIGVVVHVIINIIARSKEEDTYQPDFSARKLVDSSKVSKTEVEQDPEESLRKFSVKNSS